jgi:hypothetical protein
MERSRQAEPVQELSALDLVWAVEAVQANSIAIGVSIGILGGKVRFGKEGRVMI